MSALNPNHPVVQQMESQWYKICAILMMKHGLTDVEITSADVDALADKPDGVAVIADTRNGGFWVRLRSMKEAEALAKKAGGLAM